MRKNEIVHIVLGLIGVAGIVIAAGACPGLLACVPRRKRKAIGLKRRSVDQTVKRLLRRGLIASEMTQDGTRLVLTDHGYAELLEHELRMQKTKLRRWDGRWRLLIFDISEIRRNVRNAVRNKLRQLGFRHLQDSVWAYPFPCHEALELLQIRYAIRHDAMILEVSNIYPEKMIKQIFHLTSV